MKEISEISNYITSSPSIPVAISRTRNIGETKIFPTVPFSFMMLITSSSLLSGIIGSLSIGLFASKLVNPNGPNGLFFGNPEQLGIQAIGVGVAAALGFCGTWIIMKVLDFLVGVRVSPEIEDAGLDISEHTERAYADEEEFKLDMDTYVSSLEEKDKFFFNKK